MAVVTVLAGDNLALIQFMDLWQREKKEKRMKIGGG